MHINIGTRESALALWQTNWVVQQLTERYPELTYSLHKTTTQGDKLLDSPLNMIGDKGVFTKELEQDLLRGEIDFAVHSTKDLPSTLPDGLTIAAFCKRADPRDVLVSSKGYTLATLPPCARVGTSSLRRCAQLLAYRPDLRIENLRGNVDTRLRKSDSEGFDGIVLAAAGLERMGYMGRVAEYIDPGICLPAAGQGAIGVEVRVDNAPVMELIGELDDPVTRAAVLAERTLLARLESGCQVPIGAHGTVQGEKLHLEGVVASLDGSRLIRSAEEGTIHEPWATGNRLAEKLLKLGAAQILEEIKVWNKGE